jgi:hypothetical protein
MNDLQARDPNTAVGEVFPQRPAAPEPPQPGSGGAKRYLAPLLLASIALAINILAFLAPDPTAPTPEATIEKTEMTVDDKIKAAEQLKAHGDQLYEEGYSWLNDNDALHGAHAAYSKAWELITNRTYPEGGEDASLIADTVQCGILRDHLRIRLTTLDATFARNEKFEKYLP